MYYTRNRKTLYLDILERKWSKNDIESHANQTYPQKPNIQ